MRIAVLIVALALTAPAFAQTKPAAAPSPQAAAAPLSDSIANLEALVKQRQTTDARRASTTDNTAGVVRSRDWEIDGAHLVNKARAIQKMKAGAERDRQLREVIDHALRMHAVDARSGSVERESETYVAVRDVLFALISDVK